MAERHTYLPSSRFSLKLGVQTVKTHACPEKVACPRWDSNPHDLAVTYLAVRCVFHFRHGGTFAERWRTETRCASPQAASRARVHCGQQVSTGRHQQGRTLAPPRKDLRPIPAAADQAITFCYMCALTPFLRYTLKYGQDDPEPRCTRLPSPEGPGGGRRKDRRRSGERGDPGVSHAPRSGGAASPTLPPRTSVRARRVLESRWTAWRTAVRGRRDRASVLTRGRDSTSSITE